MGGTVQYTDPPARFKEKGDGPLQSGEGKRAREARKELE